MISEIIVFVTALGLTNFYTYCHAFRSGQLEETKRTNRRIKERTI